MVVRTGAHIGGMGVTVKRHDIDWTNVKKLAAPLPVLLWLLCFVPAALADKNWKTTSTPGTDFESAANYVEGSTPANDTSTDIVIFGARGSGVQNPSLTLGRAVGGLNFTADGWTLGGAFTLTNGAGGISSYGGDYAVNTISANLELISDSTVTVLNPLARHTLVISGAIYGVGQLTKEGVNRLRLSSGASTYSGGTVLNAGRISFDNNTTGGGGATPPTSGPIGVGPFYINAGSIGAETAARTIANQLVLAGNFQVPGFGYYDLTLSGNGVLSNSITITLSDTDVSSYRKLYLNGDISDGGSGYGITVQTGHTQGGGSEWLFLGGNNTFSGGVRTGGAAEWIQLIASQNTSLGTGTFSAENTAWSSLTANSGGLVFANNFRLAAGSMNIGGGTAGPGAGNAFTINGDISISGNRTMTVFGWSTYTLNGTILADPGGGTLTHVVGETGVASYLALAGNNKTHTAGIATGGSTGNYAPRLTISGSNNTFTGPVTVNVGSIILSGTNNVFAGGLTVNGGSLQLANLDTVAGGSLTLNGGTLMSSSTTTRTNTTPVVISKASSLGGGQGSLVLTGTINLTNLSALTVNPGSGYTVTMSGNVGGTGGLVKSGDGRLILTGAANAYSGPAAVFAGTLEIGASGTLGCGQNVLVSGGTLLLGGAGNLASGQKILLRSPTSRSMSVVALAYNGVPSLDVLSVDAVVGINTVGFDAITDLSALGDGSLWLGSTSSGTFAGTGLAPGSGATYRLGGGGGTLTLDRSSSASGVLTGARDVLIGRPGGGVNFPGTVVLSDGNDFTGTLSISRGCTLTGAAQASGSGLSPFGGTAGTVALNAGAVTVNNGGNNTARDKVEKGTLTVTGQSSIDISGGSSSAVELNFSSVVPDSTYGGALRVYASNGKVTVDTPPSANPKGILPPYIFWAQNGANDAYFTKYDAVNGIVSYTAEVGFGPGGPDDVVATGTYSLNVNTNIYGLRMGYGQVLGGTGKITFTGGGVSGPYGGTISNTLDFGSSEGWFFVIATTGQGISGDIMGSGGVSKYGKDNTSFSARARSYTGKTIIHGGTLVVSDSATVTFSQALGSNPNDAVVLNGGTLGLNPYQSGTVFARPVTVAPNGGTLFRLGYGGVTYVDGPISGTGPLALSFSAAGGSTTTLRSPANSYSGGTLIYGYASDTSGASVDQASLLGSGDVTLVSGVNAFLTLDGCTNIAATAALAIHSTGVVYMRENNKTYTIGALNGLGSLVLGNGSSSGTVTLNIAGDRQSDYMGVISDNSAGTRKGALVKSGSGTVTLWGINTYSGPTIVSNGALLVNGSIGGGTTVTNDGGILGGAGVIYRDVVLNAGGCLAPGAAATNSIGTFTMSNLTMQADCTNYFDLGAINSSDRLVVNGNLQLGGNFQVSTNTGFVVGTYQLISYSGSITTSGVPVVSVPPGYTNWLITDSIGKCVLLQIVPEKAPTMENYVGATGVTSGAAWLNGSLTSTGGSDAAVWVFYGTNDGGETASAWMTNLYFGTNLAAVPPAKDYSANATGLSEETRYYYRYCAANLAGTNWAPTTVSFFTAFNPGHTVSNLAATQVTLSSIRLSWTENFARETGFVIQRWTNGAAVTDTIAFVAANVTNYTDTTPGLINIQYFYRVQASNAYWTSDWSPAVSVSPGLEAWTYWMNISFTNYPYADTLTNFPALVMFSNGRVNYAKFASGSGYDLRFCDAGRTRELKYEIESWDTGSNSFVWVQVPEFTNNCSIWAYWGNPAATNREAYTTNGATWDSTFVGVWHMQQDSGSRLDSTTNAFALTANSFVGGETVAAAVGKGVQLPGGTKYLSRASDARLQLTGSVTLSAWIKPYLDANWRGIVAKRTGTSGEYGINMTSSSFQHYYGNSGWVVQSTNPPASGVFTYLACTRTASRLMAIYHNGTLTNSADKSASAAPAATAAALTIGRSYDSGEYYNGLLDEVRLESVARSASWIWACWMNTGSNDVFCSYGPVKRLSRGTIYMFQ